MVMKFARVASYLAMFLLSLTEHGSHVELVKAHESDRHRVVAAAAR